MDIRSNRPYIVLHVDSMSIPVVQQQLTACFGVSCADAQTLNRKRDATDTSLTGRTRRPKFVILIRSALRVHGEDQGEGGRSSDHEI